MYVLKSIILFYSGGNRILIKSILIKRLMLTIFNINYEINIFLMRPDSLNLSIDNERSS